VIFKQLTDSIEKLDEREVLRLLNEFIATVPSEEEAQEVVKACQLGMLKVGELFEAGDYFIGDLIFSGELLEQVLEALKAVIGAETGPKIGKIVLGTVQGDLHDIGKNIFKSMAVASGFEVHDIGIDQKPGAFADKIREENPEIVGMSGVLTLSLGAMKEVVDLLVKEGLRSKVKVIIGGNPVTEKACQYIGADAFTTNAAEGVKFCRNWVNA